MAGSMTRWDYGKCFIVGFSVYVGTPESLGMAAVLTLVLVLERL